VKAHQPGKHHAKSDSGERQAVVLQTDDFVVEAENAFAKK
jgi:hypothetical protein